jgi:hypothetical protein
VTEGSSPHHRKFASARPSLAAAALAAVTSLTAPALAQVTMNGAATTYTSDASFQSLAVNSLGNTIILSGANRTVRFTTLSRGAGATLDVISTADGAVLGLNQFLGFSNSAWPREYVGPWLTVQGGGLGVYDQNIGLRSMAFGPSAATLDA